MGFFILASVTPLPQNMESDKLFPPFATTKSHMKSVLLDLVSSEEIYAKKDGI